MTLRLLAALAALLLAIAFAERELHFIDVGQGTVIIRAGSDGQ